MQTTIVLLAVVLFAVAAYGDALTFRIPNALAVAVAALGILRLVLMDDPVGATYTVGVAVVVFVLGLLLFWRGFVGGGDVKLLAATVLLIGYRDIFAFLCLMSLMGAALSLAVIAHRYLRGRRGKARLVVPYGIAIAAAGIITVLIQAAFPSFPS